ncbi:class I SAM-dependent methyltransferase [Desulfocurvibacter africanus]|uniref:Class I SAM-dependent methyltransferase n=1 Tax=Desulfocurvibacter africanus subsp. africanus str. Walvis Bay TaxID=690850 RepID=F3YZF4_DESAF|nr:class I SAM-dependent methyltransferase [Desulfocurvibacter africanus]EGJ51983.1 hypothetical protein Desaf_3706 [Desulfocurvibacter africanus subsp. africanus str. Walvis Bay]
MTIKPLDRAKQYDAITSYLDHVYGEIIPPQANYGQVSKTEAEFLLNAVFNEKPSCIVEIGSASGTSTAHLLTALNLLGGTGELLAFEILEHCYFDSTKRPGFILDTIFPQRSDRLQFHTGKCSFDLGDALQGRSIDFLFIDANHTHPWATIDTILALPFLSPNATVIYHDINLHHRGGPTKVHDKGPHNLFYHLPAAQKTVIGEFPYPNIGSLRIDTPPKVTLVNLLGLLFRFPWEAQAWPPLDDETIRRLKHFLERHWGKQAGLAFLHGIEFLGKTAASAD